MTHIMGIPHDAGQRLRGHLHNTGAGVVQVLGDAYHKSGLGNLGHSLNQGLSRSAEAVAGVPADLVGGVKGAYGGLGSKLQGGADNVGDAFSGASHTIGHTVRQVPVIVRDFSAPLGPAIASVGHGVGAIGQGVGSGLQGIGEGAGGGLQGVGEGAGGLGKFAGLGVGLAVAAVAVVLFLAFAKKQGVRA